LNRSKPLQNVFSRLIRLFKQIDRRQFQFVIVLFLCGSAAVGFIALAEELDERDTRRFDEMVLVAFRCPEAPGTLRGPENLLRVVRDITSLGGTSILTLVIVAFSGYFAIRREYLLLFLLLGATLGGVLLTFALKSMFGRLRPEVVPHLVVETTKSFPSGHSSMSAVVYLTLGSILAMSRSFFSQRVYIFSCAVLITLLVGLTRIMLGVHFPTDVLAGWSLGLAWASICLFLTMLLRRRWVRFKQE
jgi:undecaprenyl-diphosphatase